jgi:hypothetical protein
MKQAYPTAGRIAKRDSRRHTLRYRALRNLVPAFALDQSGTSLHR